MIAFELAMLAVMFVLTPPRSVWMGGYVVNNQDIAVYLNYLAQGKHGFLLYNLYNNLPQTPRFDSFWSVAGLLTRTGLPPIATHEILRWICTLILGCSIYAAAKSFLAEERHARLASILAVCGLSTGWIYTLFIYVMPYWPPVTSVIPDVDTEVAVIPVLIGGAHMILSLALELWMVRWIWEIVHDGRMRRLWLLLPTILYLSFFHPYYLPLYGVLAAVSALIPNLLRKDWKRWLVALLITCAMLPGLWYFLLLFKTDVAFATLQMRHNVILLAAWWRWIIGLAPFIAALIIWLSGRIKNLPRWPSKPSWIWAWIISAIICLFLPMNWKRKYTQGLIPALTFVTFPFWLWLKEKLNNHKWGHALFIIICLIPFYHMLAVQISLNQQSWQIMFYQPITVREAWKYIQERSPKDAVVLGRDQWTGIWTPAYTERRVWIGHYPATPDYDNRAEQFVAWLETTSTQANINFLDRNGITHVISLNATDTAQCATRFGDAWYKEFERQGVAVWTRK